MTGWRLGYTVLPPALVEPVVRLLINNVSCVPAFIQEAGIEALTGPQGSVSIMVEEFKKLGLESSRLADYLMEEARVATLPGTAFGECGEGYLRLSYATSLENIEKAVERIYGAVVRL